MVTLSADTPAAVPMSPLKVVSNCARSVGLDFNSVRFTDGTVNAESIEVNTSTNGVLVGALVGARVGAAVVGDAVGEAVGDDVLTVGALVGGKTTAGGAGDGGGLGDGGGGGGGLGGGGLGGCR